MKRFIIISLLSSSLFAQTIYDLESFYASHKNRIFKSAPLEFDRSTEERDEKDDGIINMQTKGKIGGQSYHVAIKDYFIIINKTKFKPKKDDIFGVYPYTFYTSKTLACVEGHYLGASGSGTRGKTVLLIDLKKTKLQKGSIRTLPSYFGSCENIRMGKNGKITFDMISSFYDKEGEEIGLYFDEHYINDNGKHIKTGKRVKGTYLKKGISDKFTIK